MKRLFVPASLLKSPRTVLGNPEVRHLRALRLQPGDRVLVFDDRGWEHETVLREIGARSAALEILRTGRPAPIAGAPVTLIAGILKGARMDVLVEKVTELGVCRIIPAMTQRTVARPGQAHGTRAQRWKRLAISASTQSGQTRIPTIDAPIPFAHAIAARPVDSMRLLFWEQDRAVRLSALKHAQPNPAEIIVAVGPEGGFTDGEVRLATDAGFELSGLGPRTLRAETAAIVGVALCQATWGDMASSAGAG